MRRSSLVWYLTVFVVSYAGFLGYYGAKERDGFILQSRSDATTLSQDKDTQRDNELPVREASKRSSTQSAASHPVNPSSHENSQEINAAQERATVAEIARLQTLNDAAAAGTDAKARAIALVQLRGAKKSQSVIRSLAAAVTSDPSAGNRMIALGGLRRLTGDSSLDGEIKSAVMSAQNDHDPRVAKSAREIYAGLQ